MLYSHIVFCTLSSVFFFRGSQPFIYRLRIKSFKLLIQPFRAENIMQLVHYFFWGGGARQKIKPSFITI